MFLSSVVDYILRFRILVWRKIVSRWWNIPKLNLFLVWNATLFFKRYFQAILNEVNVYMIVKDEYVRIILLLSKADVNSAERDLN